MPDFQLKKGFSGVSYPLGFFSSQQSKSFAQAPAELGGEIKNRNGNREGNSSAENILKFKVGDEWHLKSQESDILSK